ncbi:biopolymer transporter ExbD [Mucilaginibacter sp.]|uniref:ExbD/TolR family protein n=1 Tax=Mucilaginibacter sp. TaxID=1882438 RepID=UPI00261CF77C|nr:biopolymer transporter ExbD [Mucilaginibacter sp.]MDB4920559.1 hypothetical protein [Mucilaginibacter sp.]
MAELAQSSGKSGGKRAVKRMPVRVDLTAMVDLAFLLITFFMLTTSLQSRVKWKCLCLLTALPDLYLKKQL